MTTAQTGLQENKIRQDKQKQEETKQEQSAKHTQTKSAAVLMQMLSGGYSGSLKAALMSREMAQRLGNAAMTALMGEDGYQPEQLPAIQDVPTDPFDADGEAVLGETLP